MANRRRTQWLRIGTPPSNRNCLDSPSGRPMRRLSPAAATTAHTGASAGSNGAPSEADDRGALTVVPRRLLSAPGTSYPAACAQHDRRPRRPPAPPWEPARHGCPRARSQGTRGLVLAEVARVHELAGEDLLGLGEHLLLAGRETLVGVADGQVADDLGDLEDVAGLELVAVVLVATAPVLGHLGGVAAQDLEDLVDDVGLDDLAQAGAIGVLDGDHDGHVVVQDLDGEVVALLAEHFLLLDLHDLARTVMRVDDLVSDLVQRLKPPARRSWPRRPAVVRVRAKQAASAPRRSRRAGRRSRRRGCASAAGMTIRSKPARPASATRRSALAAGTKFARQADLPEHRRPAAEAARCARAEAMASATARSAAGSSMRIPPAICNKNVGR